MTLMHNSNGDVAETFSLRSVDTSNVVAGWICAATLLLSAPLVNAQELVPVGQRGARLGSPIDLGSDAAQVVPFQSSLTPNAQSNHDAGLRLTNSSQVAVPESTPQSLDPYAPHVRGMPRPTPQPITQQIPQDAASMSWQVTKQDASSQPATSIPDTQRFPETQRFPQQPPTVNAFPSPNNSFAQQPHATNSSAPLNNSPLQPSPTAKAAGENATFSAAGFMLQPPTSSLEHASSTTQGRNQLLTPPTQPLSQSAAGNIVANDANASPQFNQPLNSRSALQDDLSLLLSPDLPAAPSGVETILQRFADGKVEIARQVTQDAQGNYVNHGIWKQYQLNGQLLSAGFYKMGVRHGTWFRWHYANETPALLEDPYRRFRGPFLSKSSFREGKLEGAWTVHDRDQRLITEINFRDGQRHGTTTWIFPTGQKWSEMAYLNGELNGLFRQWDDKQKLVRQITFQKGRPFLQEIRYYDQKKQLKEIEQNFLGGKIAMQVADDWESLRLATYAVDSEKQKHGPETVWFPNGQIRMKGQYDQGKPVGQFVWWHENGQKQLAGNYDAGEQSGQWVWWHETGLKSIEGRYGHDQAMGLWTWWDPQGSVTRQQDYSDLTLPESAIAEGDKPTKPTVTPHEEVGIPLRASKVSNIKD
jgi:antitoxin component YwqK of YwqJK toxin-antitoxin module